MKEGEPAMVTENPPLGEPTSLRDFLSMIKAATTLSDLQSIVLAYGAARTFDIVRIEVCRMNGVPVKESIFRWQAANIGVPIGRANEEVEWAIFREAEALMRPFNFMQHDFADAGAVLEYCEFVRSMGISEVIVIPMQVRGTQVVVAIAFPEADYASQVETVLHEVGQLIIAIFERFPTITKWPDEHKLSPREAEVLQLTATGLNEAEVAKKLSISAHTVRKHIENAKQKLDARNKSHAVSIGLSDGEIS